MLSEEILRIKVIGEFACFTRPDLKVERMSYPCMTPSAARGVLDSILWKPEFKWYVRRILILKPINFCSVKRNEINSKQSKNEIIIEDKRAQRNSVLLKDVEYIIEASIYQDKYDEKNPPKKYEEMFKRRVKKGQCWRRPYLGTREFSAEFLPANEQEQGLSFTFPIGSMLFDIFYDEKGIPEPLFFYDVIIRDGVLTCPDEENMKMMKSSHVQNQIADYISKEIYQINLNEEVAQ